MANFYNGVFWGLNDPAKFNSGLQQAINTLQQDGIYVSDQMFVFSRNLSFLEDEKLMAAYQQHAGTDIEKGILWRTAVLAWAAKHCLYLDGDFVECACMRGTTARILCDYVDFKSQDKTYYLYDSFDYDHPPREATHPRGHDIFDRVKARFADTPNVKVIRGLVPEVLHEHSPDKIALLHLDINSASAEVGALEYWFDRIVSGGLIILDDYGWKSYRDQKDAEDRFFAARKYSVMELPTGQGLVFKR